MTYTSNSMYSQIQFSSNIPLEKLVQFNREYNNDNSTDIPGVLNIKPKKYNGESYNVISYDKKNLKKDEYDSYGKFRSIIFDKHSNIVSFSPSKSIDYDTFTGSNTIENVVIEEFIEGTMINVYWDSIVNEWVTSTKSTIGANSMFFKNHSNPITFKKLFEETCNEVKLDINDLDKQICYSFVFQNPKNKIVNQITDHKIYLIEAYILENTTCVIKRCNNLENILSNLPDETKVCIPNKLDFINKDGIDMKSWDDVKTYINSLQTPELMGLVAKNDKGERLKIRNPMFEYVRQLRGNQPKIEFHYITLRKNDQIEIFLQFYPEFKEDFEMFEQKITGFITQLHTYYVQSFVLKKILYKDLPYRFKSHVSNLHNYYKNDLRPQKLTIQRHHIDSYVKYIPNAVLMHSLNFDKRDKK